MRRKIVQGAEHVIECGLRSDGVTSPSSTAWDELKEGKFENRHSKTLPDLDQIDLIDEIFVICEYFAQNGEPAVLHELNQLEQGVWEFRASWLRAAFYDTDGKGHYVAKTSRFSLSKNPDWDEIPIFDEHIRLACFWGKDGNQTREPDKKFTRIVRQEDLLHDK
ncbi:hypothetical protein AR689_19000 [Arthrobacter sp. EpRS71]|nr:hypothetical protein AR689_19000 [Arthrobacter sp. EpRS71]QSZ49569.1 hypothetical protein AYX22_14950 [Arthrobacter sp. D5-1]